MKAFQIVITPLLLLCMALSLQAQPRQTVGDRTSISVHGFIFGSDELEEKPYPLPNASIHLTCLNDTTATSDLHSRQNGQFGNFMSVLRKRVKRNTVPRIRIAVSYMGYDTFQKDYAAKREYFDDDNPSYGSYWEVDIDTIVLQSKPMSIQEVQIVGELQRMYERATPPYSTSKPTRCPAAPCSSTSCADCPDCATSKDSSPIATA